MKITTIKVGYSTSIPIAAYGIKDNAWAEVEIDLEGGNIDFDEKFTALKMQVDESVRKHYPHLFEPPLGARQYDFVTTNHIPEGQGIFHGEVSKEAIESCPDLKTLEIYFRLIDIMKDKEKQRELWLAYDEKFKELSK